MPLLEITVQSLQAAISAERAGADRIELCANLHEGGTTPSLQLMQQVRAALIIPIHVMIRPRPGNYAYSASEFAEMKSQIAAARSADMEGVVFGILLENRTIDIERTRELIQLAHPLNVTCHRAFDVATNLEHALEDVIAAGADRILTSGGAPSASAGATMLAKLIAAAGQRIIVMPCAGIRADNVESLYQSTRATEFHAGLGTILPYGASDLTQFESEVSKLSRLCRAL